MTTKLTCEATLTVGRKSAKALFDLFTDSKRAPELEVFREAVDRIMSARRELFELLVSAWVHKFRRRPVVYVERGGWLAWLGPSYEPVPSWLHLRTPSELPDAWWVHEPENAQIAIEFEGRHVFVRMIRRIELGCETRVSG